MKLRPVVFVSFVVLASFASSAQQGCWSLRDMEVQCSDSTGCQESLPTPQCQGGCVDTFCATGYGMCCSTPYTGQNLTVSNQRCQWANCGNAPSLAQDSAPKSSPRVRKVGSSSDPNLSLYRIFVPVLTGQLTFQNLAQRQECYENCMRCIFNHCPHPWLGKGATTAQRKRKSGSSKARDTRNSQGRI